MLIPSRQVISSSLGPFIHSASAGWMSQCDSYCNRQEFSKGLLMVTALRNLTV